MRLIDADAFFDNLDAYSDKNKLQKMLDRQPTAYDVEKVVEELEEKSDDIPVQYEENYEKGFDDGICCAIDIVRKGCVE